MYLLISLENRWRKLDPFSTSMYKYVSNIHHVYYLKAYLRNPTSHMMASVPLYVSLNGCFFIFVIRTTNVECYAIYSKSMVEYCHSDLGFKGEKKNKRVKCIYI